MPDACEQLHFVLRKGTLRSFPFDVLEVPANGVYVLFEAHEQAHGGPRIVRVGTHTGDAQLRLRLLQHFVKQNKDRSIFRKNIGRALLNRDGDPYLAEWERDRTSRAARDAFGREPDPGKRAAIEAAVTAFLQQHFSFVVLRVEDSSERLLLESKLVSTVSFCEECVPSERWLGRYSPKAKIRSGGLWQVNELRKQPLSQDDLERLSTLLT